MPRRNKRWQPPHPATEERAPRIQAPPPKRHTLADVARELVPEELCVWDACTDIRFHDFPLCLNHIFVIGEYLEKTDDYFTRLKMMERQGQRQADIEREHRRREQVTASRGAQPGWIYYVLTDGKVKIGYSTDITQRLRAYPPGSKILAVHPGTPDLEKLMHQRFDAHRVAGREWFRPDPEILDHCAQAVTEHGDPQRFAPKVRDPHDTNRVVGGKRWTGTKKTA